MTGAAAQVRLRRPPPASSTRARWATAAGVLLAFASVPMALSGTTVAIPAIARELGGGGFALSWVVTGYFLTASSLMLVAGTLADIVGRRRMFAIGAACFGLGALASALSTHIVLLDVARTASGVGSACLLAAGGAMLGSVFTGRARTRAFAAVGTMVGAGLAAGPALAGFVVSHLGWRAVFGLFALLALVLLVAAAGMPDNRGQQDHLDVPGALYYVAGVVLVIVGVLQATDHGWVDVRVVAATGAGTAALIAFVRRQRNATHPLLDLSLLADRHITGWLMAGLTLAVGTLGALAHIPIFLQATGRFTPQAAGLVMLALTSPLLALPPLAAVLVSRQVPPRGLLAAAAALITSGNLLLSQLQPDSGLGHVATGLLLIGAANWSDPDLVEGSVFVTPSR